MDTRITTTGDVRVTVAGDTRITGDLSLPRADVAYPDIVAWVNFSFRPAVEEAIAGATGDVLSVFGRVGDVVAESGDYDFSLISGSVADGQLSANIPRKNVSNVFSGATNEFAALIGASLTSPLIIGGTSASSQLVLRATSGNGGAGADIVFQTGNNGATEIMRLTSGAKVGIGTTTPGTLNGVSFGTIGLHVKGSGGSQYLAVDDSNAVGVLLNDSSQIANSRMWAVLNQSARLSFSSFSDAGVPTEVLTALRSGNVGVNTINPRRQLDLLSTSQAQLRLSYSDNSVYSDFTVGSGGTLTIAPTGNLSLSTVGKQIDPATNYSENLGQLSKKYLTLHAAELWVETLVAQNTLATIGGRILVGPTTTLTSDLAPGGSSIVVKHNNLSNGDRVYLEANGQIEFLAITSSGTGSGPYTYLVTRDLDGSGANQWYAGDAVFSTGTTGSGFIDIYSVRGVKSASQTGPTIVGNVRNSATWNDWSERWAIGNLNGLYGYGSTEYGAGFGVPSAAHILIDPTNGIRIRHNTTNKIVLDASGNASFTGSITAAAGAVGGWSIASAKLSSTGIDIHSGAGAALAFGTTPPTSASTGTGIWLDRTGLFALAGDDLQVKIEAATGALVSGDGNVKLDAEGLVFTQGSGNPNTIRWSGGTGSSSLNSFNGILTVSYSHEFKVGNINQEAPVLRMISNDQTSNEVRLWGGTGVFAGLALGSNTAPAATLDVKAGGAIIAGNISGGSILLNLNSTSGALAVSRMTSTQRDALSAIDGMVLYNTTTNKFQGRASGAWVDLH